MQCMSSDDWMESDRFTDLSDAFDAGTMLASDQDPNASAGRPVANRAEALETLFMSYYTALHDLAPTHAPGIEEREGTVYVERNTAAEHVYTLRQRVREEDALDDPTVHLEGDVSSIARTINYLVQDGVLDERDDLPYIGDNIEHLDPNRYVGAEPVSPDYSGEEQVISVSTDDNLVETAYNILKERYGQGSV